MFRSSVFTGGFTEYPSPAALPAGFQAGDILVCLISVDYGSFTITTPPGWSVLIARTFAPLPDGTTYAVFWKLADGTETDVSVSTNGVPGSTGVIVGAWSGRDTSAPFASFTPTQNSDDVGASSPLAPSASSATAVAGDDLAWFALIDTTSGSGQTWTFGAPSSYSAQAFGHADWLDIALSTRDNVSAGATGAVTGSATSPGGAGGWIALLIGIASGAPPPPPDPSLPPVPPALSPIIMGHNF